MRGVRKCCLLSRIHQELTTDDPKPGREERKKMLAELRQALVGDSFVKSKPKLSGNDSIEFANVTLMRQFTYTLQVLLDEEYRAEEESPLMDFNGP